MDNPGKCKMESLLQTRKKNISFMVLKDVFCFFWKAEKAIDPNFPQPVYIV